MRSSPNARTRVVALLGDPVSHSLSPIVQNAAFEAMGLDAVYIALRCAPDDLAGLLQGIASAGGAGNVTLPHKQRAARTIERSSAAVRRSGACNTFWLEDGVIHGDNTDVAAVARAVGDLFGNAPVGARVLLLGAGGAARAALCGLVDAGVQSIWLWNRTPERAVDLVRGFEASEAGEARRRSQLRLVEDVDSLRRQRFDLVVNSTSLGMGVDDPLPLDIDLEVEMTAALDLVYSPDRTPWVRSLLASGVLAEDGVSLLLYQGAASFERWWGRPAPLDVMKSALPARISRESLLAR